MSFTRCLTPCFAAALILACGGPPDAAPAPESAPAVATPNQSGTLADLDWPERIALERAMAELDPAYAPRSEGDHVSLESGVLWLRLDTDGAHVDLNETEVRLRARSSGRGDGSPLATASPEIEGPEVVLRRPGIAEWWRSLPSGLEHGFTVEARPHGEGPLVIELELDGAVPEALGADSIALVDGSGARIGTYAHISATDADGTSLVAELGVREGRIALTVDDRVAHYPVVIDPLLTAEVATLLATNGQALEHMGAAVAFSGDGTRVLVGVPGPTATSRGTAIVFVRSGSRWRHEVTLVPSGGMDGNRGGEAVALNGDGSVAVVGSPEADVPSSNGGRVNFFRRTGSNWLNDGVANGGMDERLGSAVAIDTAGTRMVAGAPGAASGAGQAVVFFHDGATWNVEATLAGGGTQNAGVSVGITSDGSRAVVGAPLNGAGRAYVHARSGTTWTLEATLIPSAGVAGDQVGRSVAISGDGVRVVAGAPNDDVAGTIQAGSATVFVRSLTIWSEETTRTGTPSVAADHFGRAVALDSTGARAAVGADGSAGSVFVLARSGSSWSQTHRLLASDGTVGDFFGGAVALTSDGSRVLSGAMFDDTGDGTDAGSAYVFAGAALAEDAHLFRVLTDSGRTGSTVSISSAQDRILVGSPFEPTGDAGAARVFVLTGTTWSLERVLRVGAAGWLLGSALDLSGPGRLAVVGAETALGTGAVRVWARPGATWVDHIVTAPSGLAAGDAFGFSVAATDDELRFLAGAHLDDTGPLTDAGTLRVFSRASSSATTWNEEAMLAAPEAAAGDQFGAAVATDRDATRAIIGATFGEVGATGNTGSAYVFVRAGTMWTLEAEIVGPSLAADDRFGTAVAMDAQGERVVVGAYTSDFPGAAEAGRAFVFQRTGTAWAFEAGLPAPTPTAAAQFGRSVAISRDGTRAIVGAPGAGAAHLFTRGVSGWFREASLSGAGAAAGARFGSAVDLATSSATFGGTAVVGAPLDAVSLVGSEHGTARVFSLTPGDPVGTPCAGNWTCAGGLCVDGVCCASACGGGATNDCMACSNALTGVASGTCAALSAAAASGVTCRAATTSCDVAETCVAGSTVCPTDGFEPDTVVCRAAAIGMLCDAEERCTGMSAACPADVGAAMGTVCRASIGSCDPTESCDGTSLACPADNRSPSGTVCRVAADLCDAAESCDGISGACPADAVRPLGSACRASTGTCDAADSCDGVSPVCVDRFAPVTTVCGTLDGLPCDAPDHCAGDANVCVPVFASTSTICRSAVGLCDTAERCTGGATSCPVDTFQPAGAVCRAQFGPCDVAEVCAGGTADCPADARAGTSVVCRAAAAPCDAPELCNGADAGCPADAMRPFNFPCRPSTGPCDPREACDGFTDVCPPDALSPAGMMCRAATGDCDVADFCTGASAACDDGRALAGTICRTTMGACDPSELCDGASAVCPADVISPAGTACGGTMVGSCSSPGVCNGVGRSCPGATPRSAGTVCQPAVPGNVCDVDDVCDGMSDACIARFADVSTSCGLAVRGVCDAPDHCAGTSGDCIDEFVSGIECRASTDACDAAELCLGSAPDCPPNVVLPADTECRAPAGGCDLAEACDGVGAACPPDAVRPEGEVCSAATFGTCDVDDVCDGTSVACAERFASATTSCGPPEMGPCDAPDFCTGTSFDCMPAFLVDTECRASAGTCDPAEACTGDQVDCPPDMLAEAGLVCRASTEACDTAEACDGASAACPADEDTCDVDGGSIDAGPRDSGAVDTGATSDAGGGVEPPAPATGCACRAAAQRTSWPFGLLVLGLLLGARQRRG